MSSEPEARGDAPSGASPSGELVPAVREQSVLTILLTLGLSALTLFGIDRGLREKPHIDQAWGETLAGDEWAFPADGRENSVEGVSFEFSTSQPGPILTGEIDAGRVQRVFADVTVERVLDGASVPYQLEWYWANAEDVASSDGWPFSPERGVTFYRPVRHRPNEHVADVGYHERWEGTVAKAVITIRLWTNEPGPFRATFHRVELLE